MTALFDHLFMIAMTVPKELLLTNIQFECGNGSFDRGCSYFQQGRVLSLKIMSEGALFVQLSASVQGHDVIAYKQNIRITWRDTTYKNATITGNCSCPVGFNCKHVAAVCLQYRQQLTNALTGANCLDWLTELDSTPPVSDSQEHLIYLIRPQDQSDELTVDIIVTKPKKSGGFNKGRKLSLFNLSFNRHTLDCFQEEDEEIFKLLCGLEAHLQSSQNRLNNPPSLTGLLGFYALQKLLHSNRLYWLEATPHALTQGEARKLSFSWQKSAQNQYSLNIDVQPEALLIMTDPPCYLDIKQGCIGEFSNSLTLKQLKAYQAAPTVPEAFADEFSMQLVTKHSDSVLPPPKPITITELKNLSPTPKLRLFGRHTPNQPYQHLMALNFLYAQWLCPAKKSEQSSVVKTEQGLFRLYRDLTAEQQAIHTLKAANFQIIEDDSAELLLISNAEYQWEAANHWNDFLQNNVPQLKQNHWKIELHDSFKLNFQYADAWQAEISDVKNDWFEMRFNVDINGKSYPLLPLILPVLENYALDKLPDTLNLHLGDYQYLTIPSEKIKPILTVLLELFNTSHLNADGTLKLSRFNVASIADLELHNYGLFSLAGGEKLRELARKLRDFSGIQDVEPPKHFYAELRPYQQQGLNWLQFLREYQFGGILADDMGLGKTIQTLAHLLLEKQSGRMTKPCLIVATTSLMSNWRREAQRFAPELSILILQGTERKQYFEQLNDYDLVLTTYPLLPRDEDVLLSYQYYYLVLDEAQTVKNPTGIAAQLVRKLKAKHRLCLTGTPMENHLGELWAQFDFLMPNFLGTATHFKKHYRTPIENLNDNERKAQLVRRIAPFMLRRTKQAVAAELPPKTEIIRTVALHPNQATLYETIRLSMEQRVRFAIEEKGLARSHITILDALLKLRQTCCDPRTLSISVSNKIQESAKLDLLMEMLPEQLEEGRRILVFSQFTRMIAIIEEKLQEQNIAYSKLTGQTQKRDAAIERFKSGEVNVFLISLKAGGVGLNLTEADTVIIYDPWWNPATETQATDRAYRIGQDKPVFVYKLVTENTVEEKILALQERKRVLADSIYDEEKQELNLTADDLTALFAPV